MNTANSIRLTSFIAVCLLLLFDVIAGKGPSVWQLVWIRADCQSEFATTFDSQSDFTSQSNVVVYAPQRSRYDVCIYKYICVNSPYRDFI
jgi:hypothetical protein